MEIKEGIVQEDEQQKSPKAAGGHARAKSLSPKRIQEIASQGGNARWHSNIPRATHSGYLPIGGAEIECFVIGETGERLLTTRGVMKALKRRWRGRKYSGTELPVFLEAKNLEPFISEELRLVLSPILFRTIKGKKSEGFRAEMLPKVCDVYLKAREDGKLTETQKVVARQCEILIRAFAQVGIIALVDEATQYQEVRDRLALQAILDAFLRRELAAWAKRFPDEFYEHIFRLKKWQWKGRTVNPPQVVANYTKNVVYERLAPNILENLEKRNPIEHGRRRAKHHQWLTEDVGHPALAQHLHAVITLMRVSTSWEQFIGMLDTAHPRRGDSLMLPFMADVYAPSVPELPPSQPDDASVVTISQP